MVVKSSEFRKHLFQILDRCIRTGEPITVPRKDGEVRIERARRRLRVSELPARPGVLVDGESLDGFSPAEWSPD